jgi:hypothetical protein
MAQVWQATSPAKKVRLDRPGVFFRESMDA